MKIILHIGQSKTGTSALQSALSRHRSTLAGHGILYPDCFLKNVPIHMVNHNSFANALNEFSFYPHLSADQYWEQFMNQYQSGDYNCLLLSGESFYGGRPHPWEDTSSGAYYAQQENKLLKLKSYVQDLEIIVIAYLRPQEKWLESAIPHIIRYAGTMGQKVYESDKQVMNILDPFLDYNHVIDLWDKIISPQKIELCEYNRQNFPEKDIVSDFLNRIGVSNKNFQKEHSADNVHDSWSWEFIEVKKKLNLKKKSRISEDTIIHIINRLDTKFGSKRKYRISSELIDFCKQKYAQGNKELSDKYNDGIPVFADEISKNSGKEYTQPNDEEISNAMQIFDSYYKSLKGRKAFLYNAIKRILRKTSPFLYSVVAQQWKRVRSH